MLKSSRPRAQEQIGDRFFQHGRLHTGKPELRRVFQRISLPPATQACLTAQGQPRAGHFSFQRKVYHLPRSRTMFALRLKDSTCTSCLAAAPTILITVSRSGLRRPCRGMPNVTEPYPAKGRPRIAGLSFILGMEVEARRAGRMPVAWAASASMA